MEDPKIVVDEECLLKPTGQKLQAVYLECKERVDGGAKETCVEEFFKLRKYLDHCGSKKLFSLIK